MSAEAGITHCLSAHKFPRLQPAGAGQAGRPLLQRAGRGDEHLPSAREGGHWTNQWRGYTVLRNQVKNFWKELGIANGASSILDNFQTGQKRCNCSCIFRCLNKKRQSPCFAKCDFPYSLGDLLLKFTKQLLLEGSRLTSPSAKLLKRTEEQQLQGKLSAGGARRVHHTAAPCWVARSTSPAGVVTHAHWNRATELCRYPAILSNLHLRLPRHVLHPPSPPPFTTLELLTGHPRLFFFFFLIKSHLLEGISSSDGQQNTNLPARQHFYIQGM